MFKKLVKNLKKKFSKKAAQKNLFEETFGNFVADQLNKAEDIAVALDESIDKIQEVVKEEAEKIEKEVKKASPAKKAPAKKAAPGSRPKGRPKKTQ
jgi:ribosomal protein L16 Arg81 hydroxylase